MDPGVHVATEERYFTKEDTLLTTIVVAKLSRKEPVLINGMQLMEAMWQLIIMLESSQEMRDFMIAEKQRRGIIMDTDAVLEEGYWVYPDNILFV